jgi:type IV pilus assembly protein PilN
VQLKKTSTGYSLEKYGLIELLPEVIVDREFMDRGALVENLRKVVEDSGIQEKKVSTVIAGKNVIIKKLMTKTPKRKEYQRVVQQLTQDNVPFDLKEIVIDAKKLREEDENTEFMIVGAKNEILYPMVDVLKEVGLVPCTADIIPFVLQAAYQKSISNEGAYLLMNIGFEHTLLVVIKDGHYFFDEEIPLGTRNFIEEIQRVCGVAADAAAQVLYGREVKDVGEPEATKAIGTASKRLLSRMERLLPEVSEWKAVIIGGGGAGISGVQKTFSDRFSASCEIVDPLKDMAGSKYPEESSMFDIAVGLAISRLEGIGVNLLPSEERVEERSRIVQALDQGLIFYSVVTTALILGIIGLSLSAKERKIEREIEDMRIQQEKLTDRVKEVKGLMAKESEIATKVRVIQDLSKHKFARVKLLDEVNRLIPHYTWLVALSEGLAESAGIKISVRGITTSNFAVSSFMKNLENSPSFTEVKLMYTQRGAIGETKTTEFEIAAAFKEQMEDSSAGKPSR